MEYSDSGRPVWVVGRLMDTAVGPNIDSLTGLFDAEKMMEDLTRCCDSAPPAGAWCAWMNS